jgi:hypothetical protein
MRELPLKLTAANKFSEEIKFGNDEEYVLINLYDYPGAETIYSHLWNATGNKKTTPLNCIPFIELYVGGFNNFKIENKLFADKIIIGKIFIGSWMEIMLLHLSQTLVRHYQIYEAPDKISFQIGLKDYTSLYVNQNPDKSFNVIRKLVTSPTSVYDRGDMAMEGSQASKLIEQIYNQIRINCSNEAFSKRQISQAHILQKNTSIFFTHY